MATVDPMKLREKYRRRDKCPTPARSETRKRVTTKRHRAFRAKLNEIKLSRGCADCGYNASPVALQFDHLPGEKKRYGVGSMSNMSWQVILAEIAKCEVVCANCHAIRTHITRNNHNLAIRAANKAAALKRHTMPLFPE